MPGWRLFAPARKRIVADKLTRQITDALTKAAAETAGLPLFASKTELGLFPNTAAAKPAAQKCVADGLIRALPTDAPGKAGREKYALTDGGWNFLLAAVNPKDVLEDFVRVLETRQGEVGELLDTARRMADSLQGLRDAVARVLPGVSQARVVESFSRDAERSASCVPALRSASRLNGVVEDPSANGHASTVVATKTDLAEVILARLADWSGAAGEDCPLPELFRSLSPLDSPPTVGEFHDGLRRLHADGAVYLHPWTGPLYALPEPTLALLVGHGVAYYASLREAGVGGPGLGVRNQNTDF